MKQKNGMLLVEDDDRRDAHPRPRRSVHDVVTAIGSLVPIISMKASSLSLPNVLDGPRGTLSQLTFVPLAPLVGVLENRCFTTPHDGRWRRSRDSRGRLGPAHGDRVVGSRESDDSQNGVGLVAVASANLGGSGHCEWPDTCVSGRREEAKGGTRRRMIKAFRWVCVERSLGPV